MSIKYLSNINIDSAFFVYQLCDPITSNPKYIGVSKNLEARYRKHLNEKSITLKNNWIKSLAKKNQKPLMVVIDSADTRDKVNKLERYWIKYHKNKGIELKNMTDGGDGGDTMSGRSLTEEQSRKISLSKIGVPNPQTAITNRKHKSKVVHQIDFVTKEIINTFPSVAEASRITGCSKTNIGKFASGNIKSSIKKVGGYEWRYD